MGISFPIGVHSVARTFRGGENTVKALLEQLGFTVTGPEPPLGVRRDISHTVRVWVEKTIVRERQDRQSGPHRLGEALWSPQKAVDGRDIYANMREVRPGDAVLHLTDNEAFTGQSWAAEAVDSTFQGVSGTEWGDRPCYRIQLSNFVPINPPLLRDWLFKDEAVGVQLRAIAEQPRGRGLFYSAKLELNQGAYLTAVPESLLEILTQVYLDRTGKELVTGSFAAASVSSININESRLGAAVRLFRWTYGDAGFSSESYLQAERNYKVAFSDKWRQLVTKDALDAALSNDEATVTMATNMGRLLTDRSVNNLLSWHAEVLKGTWSPDRAKVFLTATRNLLFDSPRNAPSIDEFNAAMLPFYTELLLPTGVKPASHRIPSLMLWLAEPERQFFLQPELYNQAARALLGGVAEGQGGIMSTAYYLRARELAETLAGQLASAGLRPRDMIDVQGFLWGAFNKGQLWFGGYSYGQHTNMLPEFLSRSVYATNWGSRAEVAELFKEGDTLSPDERKARRTELDNVLTQVGESKTLTALFDLVGRPGSLLLAKSVTYDQKAKQSVIRISGVAETKGVYKFDEKLGHQLQVEWLSELSEKFVLPGRLYPLLNGTLASLSIADALDAFSNPYVPAPGATDFEEVDDDIEQPGKPPKVPPVVERTPYPVSRALDGLFMPHAEFERLLRLWRRKRNLVLQGAPGVGKTFVARRLAYSLIGYEDPVRVQMIQFHQSYSYEDFVQGYRPDGRGGFALKDGIFVEFCNKAVDDPDEMYVLIIDEINRGNLSKILGDLMLLIETDKRSAKWAAKLAYADSAASKFHVPPNLFLLGLMNTADRSLAVVDYALRRRFVFATLRPAFGQPKFRDYLIAEGVPRELVQRINDRMTALKTKIEVDVANLGPGFCIGHSFFVPDGSEVSLDEDWYNEIIEAEIIPLLQEYWFDNTSETERWQQTLRS